VLITLNTATQRPKPQPSETRQGALSLLPRGLTRTYLANVGPSVRSCLLLGVAPISCEQHNGEQISANYGSQPPAAVITKLQSAPALPAKDAFRTADLGTKYPLYFYGTQHYQQPPHRTERCIQTHNRSVVVPCLLPPCAAPVSLLVSSSSSSSSAFNSFHTSPDTAHTHVTTTTKHT
jgi:hypothetical protein